MLSFISANAGTLIVAALVLVVVAAIVAKMVRDKKRGISIVCGKKCSDCGGSCECSDTPGNPEQW